MEKRRITAIEIYNILLDEFKITQQVGNIEITLGGISAKYNGKDAIGDLLQEWLKEWFLHKDFYFRNHLNTQQFPDFLLGDYNSKDFLEIKTFNADASPAFDIANFDSYCTSLLIVPERVDADYLIISYRMINSALSIDNIWLKKVWQMTSPSGPDPVKLQVKRGQIYNIRPCTWYSSRLQYQPFESRRHFLQAISQTHDSYSQCNQYKKDWFEIVSKKYFENTGLNI